MPRYLSLFGFSFFSFMVPHMTQAKHSRILTRAELCTLPFSFALLTCYFVKTEILSYQNFCQMCVYSTVTMKVNNMLLRNSVQLSTELNALR